MLRTVEPNDYNTIQTLECVLFPGAARGRNYILSAHGGRFCLVLEEQGSILGYVLAEHQRDGWCIDRLGVRPDRQRRGIGRLLVQAVLQEVPRPVMAVVPKDRFGGGFRLFTTLGFYSHAWPDNTTLIMRLE